MEDEGAARRICLTRGEGEFIGDSAEYWDDPTEADYYCACHCGGEESSRPPSATRCMRPETSDGSSLPGV
jgi:hypothetical protein